MKIKCRKETNTTNEQNTVELQSSIRDIQEIIRNTLISVQKYKEYDIFSNTDIHVCISSLHELYQKTHNLYEKISTPLNPIYDPKDFFEIKDKLSIIISGFGTMYLNDLLSIHFGNEISTQEFKNKYMKEK